ncbi:hypothetical protein B0H11DRAFT_1353031 [Mycena galericulata]|nr:hypothetical protein B0H11DRAFT_1353031 [Mycena galericulata]
MSFLPPYPADATDLAASTLHLRHGRSVDAVYVPYVFGIYEPACDGARFTAMAHQTRHRRRRCPTHVNSSTSRESRGTGRRPPPSLHIPHTTPDPLTPHPSAPAAHPPRPSAPALPNPHETPHTPRQDQDQNECTYRISYIAVYIKAPRPSSVGASMDLLWIWISPFLFLFSFFLSFFFYVCIHLRIATFYDGFWIHVHTPTLLGEGSIIYRSIIGRGEGGEGIRSIVRVL